jgi:hypothetical protein
MVTRDGAKGAAFGVAGRSFARADQPRAKGAMTT